MVRLAIDVYHHPAGEDLSEQLDRIEASLSQLARGQALMNAEVDTLTATVAEVVQEVAATNETLAAIVTQFGEIKAKLDAAIDSNNARAIAQASQDLGLALRALSASRTAVADAATAVDPTPETPVPGATPEAPPA